MIWRSTISFEIYPIIWDYIVFYWKDILDQKIRNTQLKGNPSPQYFYFQFNVSADKFEYQSES